MLTDNKIYRAFNKIINKIDDKFQLKDVYLDERVNQKINSVYGELGIVNG